MRYCPYCGRHIETMTRPGITTCGNCGRVFDTSAFHRILSLAWLCRREHVSDPDSLRDFGLPPEDLQLVVEHVVREGRCHDDFIRLLRAG